MIVVPDGTVSIAVDGTITLTPDSGFPGSINVPYSIADEDGDTDTAVHIVTIGNAPPEAFDPDPTPGTPSIDPLDLENIIVPALDGQQVTIDLDDYLTDPNGDLLDITPGTLPAGVAYNAVTNEVTFTPTVDNNGDTVVPFTVTDNNGGTITPTITIQPVNPGPAAVNETVTTGPDTPVVINPLNNDNDPDGDALTITEINGVALTPGTAQSIPVTNGTVTVAASGTITVTPDTGFAGDINVPYAIADADGATDTAIHTVEVANAPPVVIDPDPAPGTPSIDPLDAENIIVPAVDGQMVTIDLDDYLSDPNGNLLDITPGILPAGATFNAATNELIFTPTVGNTGDTVIPFTVTDNNGGTITPTVTIQPLNPGPDAVNETDTTGPDTPVVIDPLDNDSDPDGDALTVTEINGVVLTPGTAQTIPVTNGTVSIATDGTITVTPDTGFAGDINVPYVISDEDGASDNAVHTVVVGNAPPEVIDPDPAPTTPSIDPLNAENIIVPAVDGQSVTIDLDDYLIDPNGDPLDIVPGTLPAGATFDPGTNELTFTPPVDNAGDTVIPFTVTDNNGGTIAPTVTIQAVNPGPNAVDQSVDTASNTPIDIQPLANDSDPDGDPLAISAINGITLTPGIAQVIAVSDGTVNVAVDGTITVTPDAGFSGGLNVPYTIVDQDGATDTAVHTVIVGNAPPEVVDPDPTPGTPSIDPQDAENIIVPTLDGQLVTIDLDDFLADQNGDPLDITPGPLPAGATFNPATNELLFVPTIDNSGDTVITLTATDNNGGTITPTVTVQPVNPGPDAVDESVVTAPDTPVVIDPLVTDTDPDGDTLVITEINGVVLTPGIPQTIVVPNGTVTVAADGTITVTPQNGFSGDINVPYAIVDQDGATDTAVHTVVVDNAPPEVVDPDPTPGTPSVDPQDAENIIVPTLDGQPVTLDLDDFLADQNGDPLDITPGPLPAGATFNPATNELTFVPAIDNSGDTVITLTATDNNGGTITPTVTVQPVNPGPDAVDESVGTAPDTPVVIDPLVTDTDPDGDSLAITAINGVALTPGTPQSISVSNGTVTIAANGTITVTPNSGFSGAINVPYAIVDQDGATDTAVHTIVVDNAPPEVIDPDPQPGTPSIDPQDAENIIVPTLDGRLVTIDLDDFLTDQNGDPLDITPGPLPAGATFNPATNELTFVPAIDNIGDTVIALTATDNNGGTITPTITVQPVNPAPTALDETVRADFETPVIIDPLGNDTDPDGDIQTITEIDGIALTPGVDQTILVANGTVTVAVDGTITVIPAEGFSGTIDLPYTVVDQDGAAATAIHSVVVENAPPVVVDPDPVEGTASIDPRDPQNIIIPAVDGQAITIDLDDYLADPNGGAVTIDVGSLPSEAAFDPASNELTFLPMIDNEGDVVLPLTATDNAGSTITPTITIQPINPPPVATPDTVTTDSGTPVVVDVLANDVDPDNDSIAIVGVPILLDPSTGTLSLIANDWVYTPAPGFAGDAVISYSVQDQDGAVAASIHTVMVADAPLPVGEANIDVVNVVPPVTRPVAVSDNRFEREFHRPLTDVDLVVLNAVAELDAVNGQDLAGIINLDNPDARAVAEADPGYVPYKHYAGSEGFSSGKGYRGTISVDPTDECGRFFIDTINRDNMLSIIARSTIDPERSSGVIGFSATLANGQPLPDWISPIADGEYLVDPSAGVESVTLKLTAHRESGYGLVRYVEIDTVTGEIKELAAPRTDNATPSGNASVLAVEAGELPDY